MTPKKKLIFSRVRTTLADCHAAARDDMRADTCKGLAARLELIRNATHLQLQLDDFTLEILCEYIGTRGFPFEYLIESELCSHLEFVLPLRDVALQEVHTRIPVRL